jgi:hypothetical protein
MSDTCARWRALPFPEASPEDFVDEIHKDLAYWDAMVADTIVPVMERGARHDSGMLDLEAGLTALGGKISAAIAGSDSSAGVDRVRDYDAYLATLSAANFEARRDRG